MNPPCSTNELKVFLNDATYTAGLSLTLCAKLICAIRSSNGEPGMFDNPTQEGHEASATLQNKLVSAPALTLPCSKGHLTLDTDVREKRIASVVRQEEPDGTKKPLRYGSRTLNAADQNYNTIHRRCLAKCLAVLLHDHIWRTMNSSFLRIPMHWIGSLIWRMPRAYCYRRDFIYRTLSSMMCIDLVSRTKLLTHFGDLRQMARVPPSRGIVNQTPRRRDQW